MLSSIEKLSQSPSMGLYEGKMGAALCCFKQYHITREKIYLNKGKKLLNHIAENIDVIKSFGFSDGLLGIGWGVEWLAQNDYLKLDTNTVLSEVDDEIYRLVLFRKSEELSLANGTLARILYFYKRITHLNKSGNFYRDAVLAECIILCIDELFENVMNYDGTDLENVSFDVEFLSQVFILVNKILPLRIDHQVGILRDVIAKKILSDINNIDYILDDRDSYFYANALLQAGRISKNNTWIEIAERIFIARTIKKVVIAKHPTFKILNKLSKSTNDYSWQEGWLLR